VRKSDLILEEDGADPESVTTKQESLIQCMQELVDCDAA